ncbi:hypothetical protein WN51_14446 [Melipona quadrifasciata]|uniref:Uncharacterized protein n=1 Tax=Melipona quadrifasciata TaxID=166423 RepID=A0A0M8ZXZ1_9HYME|nr:hypothetical protein WN51_14446 [Melipona quadrifasciata]
MAYGIIECLFNKCVHMIEQSEQHSSLTRDYIIKRTETGIYHTIPITSSGINEKIIGNWANYRNRMSAGHWIKGTVEKQQMESIRPVLGHKGHARNFLQSKEIIAGLGQYIEVGLAESSAGPRACTLDLRATLQPRFSARLRPENAVHRLGLFRGLGEIGFNAGHLGTYSWIKLVLDFHGGL